MACFIAPVAEAVLTTAAEKAIAKFGTEKVKENTFVKKLPWLNTMLWGGSALLAFEHVWHGEVVPWFPFLTNAASPDSAAEMLREILTTGIGMAVLVTAVWAVSVIIVSLSEKRRSAGGEIK